MVNTFHVTIIPDGNRRWASARDMPVWEGHRYGAQTMEKLIDLAYNKGVTHLSLWGSSLENMSKRPLRERLALLEIYQEYFGRLVEKLRNSKDNIKVQIIGRWRQNFPQNLVDILQEVQDTSNQKSDKVLTFLLAYSGDDEMLGAVRKIVDSGIGSDEVNAEILRKNLLTSNLPSVDLMIRTGGEPHLSAGFMMWQMANAQLYFTEKLFPDFDSAQFEIALADFASRGRRLGS